MFEQIVPSALKFYDLPDLARSMTPRSVALINTVNPLGQVMPLAEVQGVYRSGQVYVTRGENFNQPIDRVLDKIFK